MTNYTGIIKDRFEWTVIGAGPAGIAAIGQLLDAGIDSQHIAWIDPAFQVGDFGTSWKRVMSNTPVSSFIKYYTMFDAFDFHARTTPFMIERLSPDKVCPLMLAAEPLQWITSHLSKRVYAQKDTLTTLQATSSGWLLYLQSGSMFTSKQVVLALGGEGKTLPYPRVTTIALRDALDINKLLSLVSEDDVIAVFGAYQSARSVSENLAKTNVKSILHFYRSERSFDAHIGSLTLGSNVESFLITPDNLLKHIPRCNKAIYAIGFSRRTVDVVGFPLNFSYNYQNGIIAPGLYGLGLAFPEVIPYTNGRLEYQVSAIYPMIKYLKKTFPAWQNAHINQPNSSEVIP